MLMGSGILFLDNMKKLIEYFRNLSNAESKESSKRFVALYVGIVLISYIVFRFTSPENAELILVELIGFVGLLLGVAAWQATEMNKTDKNELE